MQDARKVELIHIYRNGLLNNTLPFWINNCVDYKHGGFMTSLDCDGKVIDTDKSVWQQARFTWLLGKLYNNFEQRNEWLELAKHGIRFIDEYCFDTNDGRMWFHLTRNGSPIRKRRYSFSESFAAMAYGELARATSDDYFVEKAKIILSQFLKHNLSSQNNSSKYTKTRLIRGLSFPMITINVAQELRSSINLENANDLIDHSIQTLKQYHVKEDIECVMETVGLNGELINHFDGRTLNPGHAIEGAWFIMAEGWYRDDSELIQLGCRMLDWMWKRGWDEVHGGILYFVDLYGYPVQEYWHDMKFWWPQNETIIASLLAYQLTGNEKYAKWHTMIHDWSYSHFPDPNNGEWFGYLHRDGSISSTLKGNMWKGPFHLPRMQLECFKILEEIKMA